jgi:hypothetical protein
MFYRRFARAKNLSQDSRNRGKDGRDYSRIGNRNCKFLGERKSVSERRDVVVTVLTLYSEDLGFEPHLGD